ncbi:MAG: hypothetical protein ACJ8GO_18550 [Ramlibacter sp.]
MRNGWLGLDLVSWPWVLQTLSSPVRVLLETNSPERAFPRHRT